MFLGCGEVAENLKPDASVRRVYDSRGFVHKICARDVCIRYAQEEFSELELASSELSPRPIPIGDDAPGWVWGFLTI